MSGDFCYKHQQVDEADDPCRDCQIEALQKALRNLKQNIKDWTKSRDGSPRQDQVIIEKVFEIVQDPKEVPEQLFKVHIDLRLKLSDTAAEETSLSADEATRIIREALDDYKDSKAFENPDITFTYGINAAQAVEG